MKVSFDYMDDQRPRNNLRISGILEEAGENWGKCQRKVVSTFVLPSKESTELTNLRDIIACCYFFSDREVILGNCKEVRGSKSSINEDICK